MAYIAETHDVAKYLMRIQTQLLTFDLLNHHHHQSLAQPINGGFVSSTSPLTPLRVELSITPQSNMSIFFIFYL